VLESHEVNEPTTPGMKYHHFASGVPIMLRYTSTMLPEIGGDGFNAACGARYCTFLGEVECCTSGRLGLMAKDNLPLLVRARCEGSQLVTFSLGWSAGPARTVQRLFEGLLRRRRLAQVGHQVGQVKTNFGMRDAQWWSQEYF
jgi:hypothetical protein